MKLFSDRLFLVVAAGIAGILAWLFWTTLKKDALTVLSILVTLVLALDNYRLRKQLKKYVEKSDARTDRH